MTIRKHKPRILFFDVETCPVLAWVWKTGYKMSISHDQIKKGQKFDIICICWKWDGESKVHYLDWGINKQDSSDMIEEFTKVVEQADIVVAHNGDKFDIKQINTQRLLKGQDPIAWPTSEDTLKQFRKYFAFPSYKLDYLCKTLFRTGKGNMHFQDWIDIVERHDQKALDKMINYCKKDVILLARLFNRAKKFFAPKVNVGLISGTGKLSCPRCGSLDSVSKGIRRTLTRQYQTRKCLACKHVYKGDLVSREDGK